ncbi:MAG: S8 family serine peptidase [Alphaproteobacteria bacterium]|nr:S8 family serine peptidase [Alphaproteobacteria bacterium]
MTQARPVVLAALCLLAAGCSAPSSTSPEEGFAARNPAVDGLAPLAGPASGDDAGDAEANPWLDDELMVLGASGSDLQDTLAAYGATLRRPVGPSGYGVVSVPSSMNAGALADQLQADPAIVQVLPAGRLLGAQVDADDGAFVSYQWHLEAIGAPLAALGDQHHDRDDDLRGDVSVSGLVVAVLDSGVAYEDYADDLGTYVAAEGLRGVEMVAPWDFVNDDIHPNDDHGHGTHIASLIASDGAVKGVAAGVSLMPLKVLDAHNMGSEPDLVDAIHHAVDYGADVINLSLVFSDGYLPSPAMSEALQRAWDAGVVVVGAAGNLGGERVAFPASSPLVIGVGATALSEGGLTLAPYTNAGPSVAVYAPGGDVTMDVNGDSWPDGLLAESFAPGHPEDVGYWFRAGTSQAAALTSGAAAWLLAEGAEDVQHVSTLMQSTGQSVDPGAHAGCDHILQGLDVEEAIHDVRRGNLTRDEPVFASVMPYLLDGEDGTVTPAARLTFADMDGGAVDNNRYVALVTLSGPEGVEHLSCDPRNDSVCDVFGAPIARTDDDGRERAAAWSITVDALVDDRLQGAIVQPVGGLFVRVELVALANALLEAPEPALPAWWWDEGVDAELGDLAASMFVVDFSTTGASRPTAVLFTPNVLVGRASTEEWTLDFGGTGLTTDTLSLVTLPILVLEGTGLTTDTLSMKDSRLVQLKGSGLTTDTLSLTAFDTFTFQGSGLTTDTLSFSGELLRLDDGMCAGCSLNGLALGEMMETGGWTDSFGHGAATMSMGAGFLPPAAPSGCGSRWSGDVTRFEP